MVRAPGLQVPVRDAEETRRRLAAQGTLRTDLTPRKQGGTVVFPVDAGETKYDFVAREERAKAYQDLLPPELVDDAPRAFEHLGDIGLVKIPKDQWEHREIIGAALLKFLRARAVFHDNGVQGELRVRDLERIAGEGNSATSVHENGVRIHIDVGKAYFSPRLADERGRVRALVRKGEHLVDLFGGVAPLGVQAAKGGAIVTSVDLNPAAIKLAKQNATVNHVEITAIRGDAREVAAALEPADRIVMNLPHGARDFLDAALALIKPGGVIHLHEILANDDLDARTEELASAGEVELVRHVRNYSATDSHVCFDIRVPA